jgi:hypothetical protein
MSLRVAYAEQHLSIILIFISHTRHDLEQSSGDLSDSASESRVIVHYNEGETRVDRRVWGDRESTGRKDSAGTSTLPFQ